MSKEDMMLFLMRSSMSDTVNDDCVFEFPTGVVLFDMPPNDAAVDWALIPD